MWLGVVFGTLLLLGKESVSSQQDAERTEDPDIRRQSNQIAINQTDYSEDEKNEIYFNEPQIDATRTDMIEKKVQFEDRFNRTDIFLEFGDKSSGKLVVSNCSLMLVNKTEISLLNVYGGSAYFEAIGSLDGIGDEAIVDAQFITINQYTLLLVALDRRYQVYVFRNGLYNGLLRPIEQIAQVGQHQRSILFAQGDTVYALIGNGVPNELSAATTIRIYKWRQSHFTKVSQSTIHWMRDIHQCQTTDGTTVFVVVQTDWTDDVPPPVAAVPDDTLTLLEVFVFGTDGRWRHVQNLHIRSTRLYTFHMAGKCFLITAPEPRNGSTTEKYAWEADGFRAVPQHQAVAFNYFVSTNNELALILNRNKLTAFPESDFKRGFSYENNSFGDANAMFLVDSAAGDQLTVGFVRVDRNVTALSYHIRLLGVNVEVVAGEVGAGAPGPWSSEDCFKDLGVAVADRRKIIDQIGDATKYIMEKDAPPKNPVTFSCETAAMTSGDFNKITTNVTHVQVTPVMLLKQIQDLKARIDALKSVRHKREAVNDQMSDVVVTRLWINNMTNNVFQNALLRNKEMHITGPIRVEQLEANTIRMVEPGAEQSIGATVDNDAAARTIEAPEIKRLTRLVVRSINGIDWNAFQQSAFLKNAPKPIKGSLNINESSIIADLTTGAINQVRVDTFLTVHSDQTIAANVMFNKVLAASIDTNTTNGLRFGEDVALLDGDQLIETPVIIERCSIGALALADDDPGPSARHIIGTHVEDLSQVYTGKVTIRGSLRVENLILDETDVVSVSGRKFDMDVPTHYWMKSLDQSFSSIRLSGHTTAPQIAANSINTIPVTDFLLRTLNPLQKVNLVIHSALVRGSVYTDPAYKPSSLAATTGNWALRQETVVVRGGRKTFTGTLTVDSLSSASGPSDYYLLHGMQRDQLLAHRNHIVFPCIKQFQQLTVIGQIQVSSESMDVARLNGFDLVAGIQNMARINEAGTLSDVVFAANVEASSIDVELIDQTPFGEVLTQLDAVAGDHGTIETVRIEGDAAFAGSLNVDTLNDVQLDAYFALVVSKEARGSLVKGVKRFLADIRVGHLDVQQLNEWNVSEFVANALHKNRSQRIQGEWKIGQLHAQQLMAPSINNVPIDQLTDTQDIEIESDITFSNLQVNGNVVATLSNCDLNAAVNAIRNGFGKTHWKYLEIDGPATWLSTDQTTPINKLFGFAVTLGRSQVISGDTTFAAATQFTALTTTSRSTINGVDLELLIKDALAGSTVVGAFQSIAGDKVFRNSLVTGAVLAHANLAVPTINHCSMIAMNQSLVRRNADRVISGPKRFLVPPQIYHLQTDGAAINGVAPADIVSVTATATMPSIMFTNDIHIATNLVISDTLNGMPLNFFLDKRLRQFGPAQEVRGELTFEHLIIQGNHTRLVTINNIPIDDVVLQKSDDDQMVSGRKRMLGTLSLDGPVAVSQINGVDLVDTFHRTVWLDDNATLARLTVINNITLQQGMIVQENLNGADVMAVMYAQPPGAQDMQPIQREILKEIHRADMILQRSQSNTSNVYLDYAADIKIRYTNQSEADTFIVDTTAMCGQCQCQRQNFVSITKFQVNIVARPPFDRVIRLVGAATNVTIKTVFEEPIACRANGIQPFARIEWNGQSVSISETSAIRNAQLFEQGTTTLLLVHQLNRTVTVLRLDANEWLETAALDNGAVNQMYMLTWDNVNTLLLAIVDAQPGSVHGTAQMYDFDEETRRFRPLFAAVSGDFDQCAWLHQQRRGQFMVWLGRTGSAVITVFKAVRQGSALRNLEMLQTIIVPDTTVKSLVAVRVQDSNYMAVVTQNSFLQLYKFDYLAGWVRATFGYFKDIETVVPFSYYQRDYLYVSMKSAATALVVHQRG